MALSITSTVRLNNGVEMPWLGLGTWQAPQGQVALHAVTSALKVGYRLIDTAAAYGNEESVGEAVRESGLDRGEVFITTKVWTSDQGYRPTLTACQQSLQRLGLSYVDLYLIHWPAPGRWPESWRAMTELLAQGKCRAIGVSNFEISHLEELRRFSNLIPAVNQIEFNPFVYRKELSDYCRRQGIQLESYSPLTRGERLQDPRLRRMAATYGKTPAQVLIRWALQHSAVVIPKSIHPERIRENAEIFDFAISPQDMEVLDHLGEPHAASGERRAG